MAKPGDAAWSAAERPHDQVVEHCCEALDALRSALDLAEDDLRLKACLHAAIADVTAALDEADNAGLSSLPTHRVWPSAGPH